MDQFNFFVVAIEVLCKFLFIVLRNGIAMVVVHVFTDATSITVCDEQKQIMLAYRHLGTPESCYLHNVG